MQHKLADVVIWKFLMLHSQVHSGYFYIVILQM